jgi:malonate-semialdehyde dehydrogenase (acetylating)/methylmalonate-semialdehyde dehydrogenase
MGPVVSKESQEKIVSYIDAGINAGADLKVDGRSETERDGFFVGGCLFDHVTSDMSIYTDEIFGPVLSVVRVSTYDEALKLVNDHEYGNGTAIFTRDGDTARHFTTNVKVGMVGVNIPIPVPVAMHSFGGWKRSLFGGSSIHGMEGVRFYTQLKTITSRWPSGIRKGAQFNFESGKDV